MVQQGQVFKLKARGADGRRLWAYRHRLEGRASARPQVGGFASRAEAEEALRKALARLLRQPSESGLRIWVPACSTGEEVYSVAISMLDHVPK